MSEAVLEVVDLHKTFRIGFFRKRIEAVRGVSFKVNEGEIFGLLGPNGAGKTTALKCLLGLIHPDRGEMRLFGEDASLRKHDDVETLTMERASELLAERRAAGPSKKRKKKATKKKSTAKKKSTKKKAAKKKSTAKKSTAKKSAE